MLTVSKKVLKYASKTAAKRRLKTVLCDLTHCDKLVEIGLVKAKRAAIQGKVREFNVVQEDNGTRISCTDSVVVFTFVNK